MSLQRIRALALAIAATAAMTVMVSGAGVSHAAAPKPAAVNNADEPITELVPLRIFVGTWDCNGTASDPSGTTESVTMRGNAKFELGGHWLNWVGVEQPPTGTSPYAAQWLMGWDASRSVYTVDSFDNLGSRVSETTTGWAGDDFVSAGQLTSRSGNRVPSRTTITRTSDDEFRYVTDLNLGQWFTVNDLRCSRV